MSLARFIADFNATTKYVVPDAQVIAVEKLVKDYINQLLNKVGATDDRFKACSLVPAGSFYENTRVSHVPDEFDFITTLERLSDDVIFEPGCNGYAKLKVKKNLYKWTEFCQDEYVMSENIQDVVGQNDGGQNIMDQFYRLVVRAVNAGIKQVSSNFGSLELERLEGSARGGVELNLLYKYEPKNTHKDVYDCTMTSCIISVDLVPAVRFSDVSNLDKFIQLFPLKDCVIFQRNGCFLIPKSCQAKPSDHQCWRFTFSQLEMALINDMDDRHKACYRVIKSVYIQTKKYVHTQGHLCSYVIKTAMLYHYNKCRLASSEPIRVCLFDIFDYLIECCKDYFLPSFFDINLNIFNVIKTPIGRHDRQTGDIKYLSERPDGVRYVSLICRSICKTPVVSVRWGHFIAKCMELVRGIFVLIQSTPEIEYNFKKLNGMFVTMNTRVKEFFDVPKGSNDSDFFYTLYIRDQLDDESLLGFSALVETIEEDLGIPIPIKREQLKAFFEHVRINGLIPRERIPPGWSIVNLSLLPDYTETSWRTYHRLTKKQEVKANCTLDFFNHSGTIKEHDIYYTALTNIKHGEEIYLKFGSVTGAYDRIYVPTCIGDLELSVYLERVRNPSIKGEADDEAQSGC